jgi:IclR family transcriptional regulator, acetate operon repressor
MDGEMSESRPLRERPRTAIAKVTAVVEGLAHEHSVSAVARATGLPISTVHRIVQELTELGWARGDGEHGYMLGPQLLSLAGHAASSDAIARAGRPILRRLSDEVGYAAHLAVRDGDEVVYVDKVEGRRAYHMRSRIGLSIPMHCTGIGKALLAHLPTDEVREIVRRTGMRALTEHTITDPGQLVEHLEVVRERGCAIDDQENEQNIRCVAAAIVDHRGIALGGLSVSGLAFELDDHKVEQLVPLVRGAAQAVTASLGGGMQIAATAHAGAQRRRVR